MGSQRCVWNRLLGDTGREKGCWTPSVPPFPPPLNRLSSQPSQPCCGWSNFVAWSAHESFSAGMSTVRSQWLRCFQLRLAVVNTCTDRHVHTSTKRLRRSPPFSSLLSPLQHHHHHTTPHTTPHHTTHNTPQHTATHRTPQRTHNAHTTHTHRTHNAHTTQNTTRNTTHTQRTHNAHTTHTHTTHTQRTLTTVTICLLHTMRNTSGALRFRALKFRSTNLFRCTRLFSFPIFDQLRGCRLRCRFGLRGRTEQVHSIRDQFFCHWSGRAHSN